MKFSKWGLKNVAIKEILITRLYNEDVGMEILGPNDLKDPAKGLTYILRLPSKTFSITDFAKTENLLRWTHFTMTYSQINGVCVYVNGNGDDTLCTLGSSSGSATSRNLGMRVGWKWPHDKKTEFYFDDLAIWRNWLSSEEVQFLYNHSKLLTTSLNKALTVSIRIPEHNN